MTLPTFEEYQSAALAQGFDHVEKRRWSPLTVVETHAHPFAVRALMVQGELWLSLAGTERHLRAGDIFEIDRDTPHAERYGPEGATYWAARRHKQLARSGADESGPGR
jgi:AraC-like ligand binding domain